MTIDIDHFLVALVAAGIAALVSRLWHARRIAALRREVARREAAYESAARLGQQARKQVEELQRVLSEYRRRLSAAQNTRAARPAPAPAPVTSAVQALEAAMSAAAPRAMPPGGWADTQPM